MSIKIVDSISRSLFDSSVMRKKFSFKLSCDVITLVAIGKMYLIKYYLFVM